VRPSPNGGIVTDPTMEPEIQAQLQALEAQLEADPSSELARQEILYAYGASGLVDHPRRLHHVVEYIRRFPRTEIARAPFVSVDAEALPEAFAAVEQVWARLQQEHPADPEIARGFAAFVAASDPPRAMRILEDALRAHPENAGLWLEIGRICPDPGRRLGAFLKVRGLGASHPNLLTLTARAALDAGDASAAKATADQLLALVAQARSVHGEKLDWPERGRDLWQRVRAASAGDQEARRIVGAIADHANHKHWAHTTLGLLAVRDGDVTAACHHLRESAAIVGDPRLSSYGPSFKLARELYRLESWDAVTDYLRACERFWDVDVLRSWQRQVAQRQTPEFPDR